MTSNEKAAENFCARTNSTRPPVQQTNNGSICAEHVWRRRWQESWRRLFRPEGGESERLEFLRAKAGTAAS